MAESNFWPSCGRADVGRDSQPWLLIPNISQDRIGVLRKRERLVLAPDVGPRFRVAFQTPHDSASVSRVPEVTPDHPPLFAEGLEAIPSIQSRLLKRFRPILLPRTNIYALVRTTRGLLFRSWLLYSFFAPPIQHFLC